MVAASADALPRNGAVAIATLSAALGYFALARGVRLLPATYAAILAGVGAALAAARLHGSF